LRKLLFPFSILYGLVIGIRHKLFDWKLLKSTSFSLPVICVGNIAVGGTGKTPHIEYLVNLLHDEFKIAVLSRGYKRKTKGFQLAEKKTTPLIIGDEPYQIFKKFSKLTVAVCEDRVMGIKNLLNINKKLQAILLDDAFQHRYVNAGLNIVLIDYSRPVFRDLFLPAGDLRDSSSQLKRADIILVTKTPQNISALDIRLWKKQLKLFPYQKLYFTTIDYEKPVAIFSKKQNIITLKKLNKEKGKVLLVSGIANPKPLIGYLKSVDLECTILSFPDHHHFTNTDLNKIKNTFNAISGRKKIIITTEKDAVRFKHIKEFPRSLRDKIYYLPIRVAFLNHGQKEFDKIIKNYVRNNKKVGRLYS
jgi:tetraacyldisaccharide 4'-kinase